MNQKTSLRNTVIKDQTKNQKMPYNSLERVSISQSNSINEFFNRQKLYDDIYNSNQFKSESLKFLASEKTIKHSKYKDVVESAKLKFATSPNNIRNNMIQLQQNSITDIVEQFRNQKKTNNVKLNNNPNNPKKFKQLNLNLILVIAIPLICCLVVLIEMSRLETQYTD
ncbi:unnamed protein product [Paramecium sonneborni]|uniref:Transmembrane protein n=1 Tax=Paramecium sonneborni TaxID=65129 RepID=A0A8S1R1C2_9CILI|nr:unnamed protein product [Paramecium sonneborni]